MEDVVMLRDVEVRAEKVRVLKQEGGTAVAVRGLGRADESQRFYSRVSPPRESCGGGGSRRKHRCNHFSSHPTAMQMSVCGGHGVRSAGAPSHASANMQNAQCAPAVI